MICCFGFLSCALAHVRLSLSPSARTEFSLGAEGFKCLTASDDNARLTTWITAWMTAWMTTSSIWI